MPPGKAAIDSSCRTIMSPAEAPAQPLPSVGNYRLALWAVNLGPRFLSLAAWLEHVEARARGTRAAGARLLVMPEYACEAWLGFKPSGLRPDQEIAWLAGIGAEALPALQRIAAESGVALLAGSMPWPAGGGFRNRAWLTTPCGRLAFQDKLCLTPFERDPASWVLQPGDGLRIVELDGLRVAILVCLDVELPALACLLAAARLDLVLVPSMTDSAAGNARVFGCAKARAVELMCAVACTGVVGASPGTTQNDGNVSGVALYVPCEPELAHRGVLLETALTDGAGGEEPFAVVDVPVGVIRGLRASGGEVWPGSWSASHLRIDEGWQVRGPSSPRGTRCPTP
jgi:predicted amidohydrolase